MHVPVPQMHAVHAPKLNALWGGGLFKVRRCMRRYSPLLHTTTRVVPGETTTCGQLSAPPAHDAWCAWAMHACSQPLTQVPPPASRLCCPCSELALLLMLAAQQPQIERDNVTDIHAAY